MASSSSSSSIRKWRYDVFLSFRGEDTRRCFTDHLYTSLKREGIEIFRDENEIQNGIAISSKLLEAIEGSRIAIVVLSKNYASSTWCLEELVKILQCKKELGLSLLPIFYDVDPSDVRKQNGTFAEAFKRYDARFGEDDVKVLRWREALSEVANLKGWNSNQWSYESEFIEEISKEIWTIIRPTLTKTMKNLIGVESKLKGVVSLLNVNSGGVFAVGIWGMGGVGKTTIARAIYDQIYHNFEVCSFLSNIREEFQRGLTSLQGKFLSKILRKKVDLWDTQEGSIRIEKVLSHKKILVVLDDVDELDQIKGLIPNQDLFGFGSRIIITTRNEDLLITFGVERRYKIHELKEDEALQLLSLNAFKKTNPEEGYLDLSKSIVKHVGGLPLALEVLGSSLCNKNVMVWNNTIAELEEGTVDDKIYKALRISFDGLDEKEREIFLDIACFFKGKKKEHVVEILDGCGFRATKRIELLIQKSLITIKSYDNRLQIHDLLQEMGRKIIRQNSSQNFWKNSRLWDPEDVAKAIPSNMSQVIEEIQTIHFKSRKVKITISDPEVFSRMYRLRLLNVCNIDLPKGLMKCIPNELRYLKWRGYPVEFLQVDFEASELIEVHICHSELKQFWTERKCLNKLKRIRLCHSEKLLGTPDFMQIPNLERLDLEGCTNLRNIHGSVFSIKKLLVLNLKNCKNLQGLPNCVEIEVLRILILSGCSKIKKVPEFEDKKGSLLELSLGGTSISELPTSIGNLSGLTTLNLANCSNLISIPSSLSMLKCLESLDISGCSRIGNQLSENLENVEELDVRGTAIREAPQPLLVLFQENSKVVLGGGVRWLMSKWSWFSEVVPPIGVGVNPLHSLCGLSLTELKLNGCNLGAIPDSIGYLSSLKYLYLSDNNFSYLPATISRLSNLQLLMMDGCKRLLSLSDLPPFIRYMSTKDCNSLKNVGTKSLRFSPVLRTMINFSNSHKLENNDDMWCRLLIKYIQVHRCRNFTSIDIVHAGSEVPTWYTVREMGSSIHITLDQYSPNVLQSMGVAICAVFGPNNDWSPFCAITSISSCTELTRYVSGPCSPYVKSEHIWLHWEPLRRLRVTDRSTHLTFRFSCSQNDLPSERFKLLRLFETPTVNRISKCGVRLILREEIQNLHQTMDQWNGS